MIYWKIKAWDFSLFNNDEILEQHWLNEDSIIEIVLGLNGNEYSDSMEQVKRYYCADFFYPKEIDQRWWINDNWYGGELWRYSTYPVLMENIIELYEKKDDKNDIY